MKYIFLISLIYSSTLFANDPNEVNPLCYETYPIKSSSTKDCEKFFKSKENLCLKNMEMIGLKWENTKCIHRILLKKSKSQGLEQTYKDIYSFTTSIRSHYGQGGSFGPYCNSLLVDVVLFDFERIADSKDLTAYLKSHKPNRSYLRPFKNFIITNLNKSTASFCSPNNTLWKGTPPKNCKDLFQTHMINLIGNWSIGDEKDACNNWWTEDFN